MDIATLDLFLAVARHGGFAAAAKERDLDPSSVSRIIAGLEAELGARLFQRTTRRLSLTEAGEAYRTRIETLIDELARAGAEAANANTTVAGTLRLTASVAFGIQRIAPLLREFRARHPALKLDCLFTDANLDLVADRIDLAVRLAPAVEGDLIAVKLMATRYHVVATPAYLAQSPPLMRPADLAQHRCLLLNLRPFRTRWRFRDHAGAIEEIGIDGDIVISTPLGVRAATLADCGPALLSNLLIAEDLKSGALIDVFPDREATATTFDTAAWAIYPSRAFLPHKVRVAIDFLRSHLARG
jgi:DNA-binding transcriptional LysR family regulator